MGSCAGGSKKWDRWSEIARVAITRQGVRALRQEPSGGLFCASPLTLPSLPVVLARAHIFLWLCGFDFGRCSEIILRHLGLVCRRGEDGFVHGSVCRPLWGWASGKWEGLLTRRFVEQQSPIVHHLGRDRAGTVAFGRFIANRSVMPAEIFAAAGSALGARAAERHVLAIPDTTHLSFPRRASEVIAPHDLDFAVARSNSLSGPWGQGGLGRGGSCRA